jgi:hypothetical protein
MHRPWHPTLLLLLPLLFAAGWSAPARAQQEPQVKPPLSCAVVGNGSARQAGVLCKGLGSQLGRATVVVEDGSSVRRGEALHIVQGDVAWTLVLLRDGRPRAFMRVSTMDAAGRELDVLTRASRVLFREASKDAKDCLRVEPNGGRSAGSEVAYPWVSLKQCRVHLVDVIDPWWQAPQAQAGY